MTTLNELIPAHAAAAHLGLSRARLYALSRTGKLGQQVGGYWLYTRAELNAWQAQRNPKGGRPKKRDVLQAAGMPKEVAHTLPHGS